MGHRRKRQRILEPGSGNAKEDLEDTRSQNEKKLQGRFAAIYAKYSRDFEGWSDEVDNSTGQIVVDNGHLRGMRHERDIGRNQPRANRSKQQEFDDTEDELDVDTAKPSRRPFDSVWSQPKVMRTPQASASEALASEVVQAALPQQQGDLSDPNFAADFSTNLMRQINQVMQNFQSQQRGNTPKPLPSAASSHTVTSTSESHRLSSEYWSSLKAAVGTGSAEPVLEFQSTSSTGLGSTEVIADQVSSDETDDESSLTDTVRVRKCRYSSEENELIFNMRQQDYTFVEIQEHLPERTVASLCMHWYRLRRERPHDTVVSNKRRRPHGARSDDDDSGYQSSAEDFKQHARAERSSQRQGLRSALKNHEAAAGPSNIGAKEPCTETDQQTNITSSNHVGQSLAGSSSGNEVAKSGDSAIDVDPMVNVDDSTDADHGPQRNEGDLGQTVDLFEDGADLATATRPAPTQDTRNTAVIHRGHRKNGKARRRRESVKPNRWTADDDRKLMSFGSIYKHNEAAVCALFPQRSFNAIYLRRLILKKGGASFDASTASIEQDKDATTESNVIQVVQPAVSSSRLSSDYADRLAAPSKPSGRSQRAERRLSRSNKNSDLEKQRQKLDQDADRQTSIPDFEESDVTAAVTSDSSGPTEATNNNPSTLEEQHTKRERSVPRGWVRDEQEEGSSNHPQAIEDNCGTDAKADTVDKSLMAPRLPPNRSVPPLTEGHTFSEC